MMSLADFRLAYDASPNIVWQGFVMVHSMGLSKLRRSLAVAGGGGQNGSGGGGSAAE